jgi:site-specific DNA-cytosine methylase
VKHNNCFRLVPWDRESNAVTGGTGPSADGLCVADPRAHGGREGKAKYRIVPWNESGGCVIGNSSTGQGAYAVADPRPQRWIDGRRAFEGGGHYGVSAWGEPSATVLSAAKLDRGPFSVADPRLPGPDDRPSPAPVIIALDGTWHRPFTTLELAVLQGYDPAQLMEAPLSGKGHTTWRQHIGNRVPPPAAQAIAEVFGETLLRAALGEGWRLDTREVWVRQVIATMDVAGLGAP